MTGQRAGTNGPVPQRRRQQPPPPTGPQRRRASWAIQTALFFRYFRLVLDPAGNSAAGGALALNGLELHGELRAPPAGVAPAYRSPPLVPGTARRLPL